MVKRGERRRGKEKKKLYIVLGLNSDSLLPPPTTNFSRRKRNIYFLGVKTRREGGEKKKEILLSPWNILRFLWHIFIKMEQTLLLCKADACKRIRPNGGAHKMQKRDVQRREQRSNRARSETESQWIYLSRATHLIQTCVITNNRRPLSPFLFLTRYVDPFFFSFLLSFFFENTPNTYPLIRI